MALPKDAALVKDILRTMDYGPSPEANDSVRAWLAAHAGGFGHFIGGETVLSAGTKLFAVENPATGGKLADVAEGSQADVDAAVAAARAALDGWSALPGHARARYLYAIARQIQKRERFLAVLETMDNGKPIRESRDIDVPLVARHFYHHAGWAELVETELPGTRPVGVCGQIVPWNFPLLMLAWKVAPALAAGCTVVLKPAELTPLSALAFAEVCRDVGLPPGVVNIVCGDGTTGALLAGHPGIDKIAFTGSTDVGRAIREATAGSGKALSLELGGKSPFIVFEDSDLDGAVEGVVDSVWFNQGEVCCAGARILVQEGVAERLAARLKARMARLRVGDPLDKSTDIGAVVAPVQRERIAGLVATARTEGGTVWQAEADTLPAQGCFYPPTLITDVEPAMTVAEVEIFGPVATLTTFRTPDEAVQLANHTRYGLAASIWTQNIDLALDVAAKVKAGVVWINAANLFDAAAPFGGYKESGFGREGGIEGLSEYRAQEHRAQVPGEPPAPPSPTAAKASPAPVPALPPIDRTAKLFVGGRQVRPDGGAIYPVLDPAGRTLGEAGLGNRKDIRNAVEAAAKAGAWSGASAHNRAQVLYYIAENLSARADEFARRIAAMTGASPEGAADEVEASIRRIFRFAAFADKLDGRVHAARARHATLAVREPFGTMGVVCPEAFPLLGFVSMVVPAIAAGNRVVAVPSETAPLAATDFYQVLETSDVPAGVVNIVTGGRDPLALTLAEHDDVDALWYCGPAVAEMEKASAGNLKATWCHAPKAEAPLAAFARDRAVLERATQVKTIWIPYGI